MSTSVYLTSSGLSITLEHTEPASPDYTGKFTLTKDLYLTVTFNGDTGNGNSRFNYDVGFEAIGNNNETVKRTDRLSYGTTPSGYYGESGSVTLTADISNLTFPISLYFLCGGCDNELTGGTTPIHWQNHDGWIIYDGRHTHIDNPESPTITSTTGKTITVSNGKDGLYCTTTNDGWYDTPHKFTGLTQGASYKFKCREYCPDCPDNKVYESSTVTGKTWSISGRSSGGMGKLTFSATHIAGTGGDDSKTITYKLYTSEDASDGTLVGTKTSNSGGSVTFTGLDGGTAYYCHAYTTGITDNDCWITNSTKKPATVGSNNGDVSATTLRASVSWSSDSDVIVTCTVYCNGSSRSLSSSGSYVGFTGLIPGSTYTVSYSIISTYNIYDEEDKDKIIGTESIESSGSFSLTTKKATLVFDSITDITSKIIRFKSYSNYPSDTMEQKIYPGDDWESVDQNTYAIYNNLTHNTSYTIYCQIAGCYAFNSSGGQTNVNDSIVNSLATTKLLSLAGSISEQHQHSLVTIWQAYIDGVARDRDTIDNTAFEFTYKITTARKNNPPYQSSEVIEASDGNTTGTYQYDKKIYSNNLTWYYCEYIVSASLTDGFNIVSYNVVCHTTFPATWIFSGGEWHRYMGHVYTNGEYVPAPVFVYRNNKYNESNGEY